MIKHSPDSSQKIRLYLATPPHALRFLSHLGAGSTVRVLNFTQRSYYTYYNYDND